MSELIKKFYKERLPNGPSSRLLLQLRLGPSRKLRNDLGAGGLQVCIQGKDLVCGWVCSLAVLMGYVRR